MSDIESESINLTSDEEIIPYYIANKTTIAIQKKDYYKKNRDKILVKTKCECGRYISKNQMLRHQRTKVHQQYLELINREKSEKEVTFD